MTGLIFDMDGTLWDSSAKVAESWTQVLKKHPELSRQSVTRQEIQSWMGKTMENIAALMLPELAKDVQMSIMDECAGWENEALRKEGGILYPDLVETLSALAKRVPLFIVSNCQSGYIEAFLAYYGLESLFTDIECYGNTGREKSYSIRLLAERNGLDHFWYVGDTQGDYDATAEAGGSFIFAAYGFGTVREETPRIGKFSDLVQMTF